MKKLKNMLISIIIMLLILIIHSDLHSQEISAKTFFTPIADEYGFSPVFGRFENQLKRLYSQPELPNLDQFFDTDKKMKDFASILIQMQFISPEEYNNYFELANKEHRLYRQKTNKKYLDVPTTRQVASRIKTYIEKNIEWNWKFQLVNKYILIVKVKSIYRDEHSNIFPFYSCDIVDDIKGNFYDKKTDVIFSGNFDKVRMKPGNVYIILCLMKSTNPAGDQSYLIRGHATEDHGIFPIENNMIIDKNNVLRLLGESISVVKYKAQIKHFLYDIAGVNQTN